MTKITGRTIRKALEHSAYLYNQDSNGGFLQVSGIKVTYDFCKPKNKRVMDVQVRCSDCIVPFYEPLDDKKMYTAIVPTFLLLGGDGHVFHERNTDVTKIDILKWNDAQALTNYVRQMGTIYNGVEGRITILDNCSANRPTPPNKPGMNSANTNHNTQLLTHKIMRLLIIIYYAFQL